MEYSPPGQGPYLTTQMTLRLQDSTITSESTRPSHFTFPICCFWDFRWISMERMVPPGDISKASLTAWQLPRAAGDCPSASSMFLPPQPAWVTDFWCKGQPLLTEFSWHWHQTLHKTGEMPRDWKWQFHFGECNGFPRPSAPPCIGLCSFKPFGCLEHTFVQCKHFKIATGNCSIMYPSKCLWQNCRQDLHDSSQW